MAKKELFEHGTKKEFNFFLAMIPLTVMVITMLYAIVVLETDPHLPLMIGTITAAVVAIISGFKFDDLEEMMYKGIRLALPAVVIIMLVGLIIGSWIGGGIVATMIYYGLMIINPQYFLVTICVICGIVSLAIGSSWSTMATIGVAGMGIGVSMGINPAMIAGAVISGSYFGDKMSPLSDTTNLASGLTNTDLFVHIKHMLYTTIPGLIIALIVFFFIGINVIGTNTASPEDIQIMLTSMDEHFVISPWLLSVPVLVILCIILKIKAVPALVIGVLLGFLCSIFVQGATLADSASFLMNGFVLESNNEMVDNLFNRGGLMEMMYTISMTIVAMTFAGILEYTGMLSAIMNQILKIAKGTFGIISATIISCFATNATCSEQYISIVVPSRMFLRTYIENNLHSKNLSRSLEDGGTLTSVFIPWNTCGVFIYGTLGVSALEYAPFAILNFTVPVIALILAATGIGIAKITSAERDAYLAEHYPEEQQEKPVTV
ncbi:Na+/H+ antiporter NhaC [Jeotgalicoccus coquinae]|uniref:Na(+)/H(+) antiporter NhaC n=1 Tax=Jeotgalicoccus coquinae TaxID=709509 RepID=A0A6V7R1U2_9STAP|nr:Na+/H+ antiporter NhaC [Jeotgalicoccus coquinae]MBB6423710.1 NhaC family Na+:H+ antiporter [Jeotgalicoccus coquinae]GGE21988.1 Na+/H+ antiporter NhaC [Jeotgalicoccus coquinae]CAD2071004.1 Na(+)/H(+) antiporter NhaC [Jeotgalicoccus coquinae]